MLIDSLHRLAECLDELAAIDLGYPQGENEVWPPKPGIPGLLADAGLGEIAGLLELYSACDGISMPDVHVGYFIHPSRRLLNYEPSTEPQTIHLRDGDLPVLLIGSDGGGDLFVVRRDDGRVLFLRPGLIVAGVYDGRLDGVRVVARDITHFLEFLIEDAEAFLRDDRENRYMASPDRR